MSSDDFAKIWGLFRTLFSPSPRVNSEKERIVWEVALRPYSLDDVTSSVMAWARKSKFFPDIADITGKLTPVEAPPEKLKKRQNSPYGDTAWMAPYIRKMAARITEEDLEGIHAAGLLTWGEAEEKGVDFADWNREYREKFPVWLWEAG